jgi:hypothetical protein
VARSIVAFIDYPCCNANPAWTKGYSGRCTGFQWKAQKRPERISGPIGSTGFLLPARGRPREKERMRAGRFFSFISIALASPAAAAPQALGVFGGWGAFAGDGRCYAISAPAGPPAAAPWRPFAAVGHWPGRGGGGQLHVRLSREKRQGSAVLLRVDGRSFQLAGGGRDAWASDPRADQEIQAAMRTGIDMIVETRAADGAAVRDRYGLRGAATAMDAAAIACIPRR